MWNTNASNSATIGFSAPTDLPNARVYYDTVDRGTAISSYAYSRGVDARNTSFGLSNMFSRLTSLQPSTVYYFVIANGATTTARYFFRTSSNQASERLSLVVGGDSRNNRVPRQNANKMVAKLRPDAVLFGGDMTNTGSPAEWQEWFQDWQLTIAKDGRVTPVIITRGNHELDNSPLVNLFDTPATVYYAVSIGGSLLRVYTLNSETAIGGAQTTWLESDLSRNMTASWRFAQYHRPMRPHVSTKTDNTAAYTYWAPLFQKYRVRLVSDSDSHTVKATWPIRPDSGTGSQDGFLRDDQNGTVYLGEGCWGAPLRTPDDLRTWTRDSGQFNSFHWVFLDQNQAEVRTVMVDNADQVGTLTESNRFSMPSLIRIWSPSNGSTITIPR